MELTYSILAFYLASWIMLFARTWIPAMKIIGIFDPKNVVYYHRLSAWAVYASLIFLAVPFLMQVIFSDRQQSKFVWNFIGGISPCTLEHFGTKPK